MEKKKNLSEVHTSFKPSDLHGKKIGIVTSEWNFGITGALQKACVETLLENGIETKNIIQLYVPGAFELPLGAKKLINRGVDAVVCLGCIIQGETRHFEFIANAVAQSIMNLGLENNTPVIFGVLTTNDMKQAEERSGGKHGNKGIEAAMTCLKMIEI